MSKLQPYKKLKSTESIWLPQVPEHWELVKVRHLFKESTQKGFPNETLLVASQEHGVVSKDTYGKRTVEATKDLQNLKLVEKGDFVISLRSFQGGIELAHERGIISPAYTIMKETRLIDKRYFKNLFKSPPFISLMTLCVKGIREGQNIDYPTFKNEYLPFPPLAEQQAIAAYLDKKNEQIDKFINGKLRLIENLKELKNQIIENLITKGLNDSIKLKNSGLKLFGNIPNHWQVKRLRHVSRKVKTGTTPSGKANDYFENGHFNWFTPGDFNEDYLLLDSERKVNAKALKDKEVSIFPSNSVLIIGIGGTIGKVGLITSEASSNQQINAITFNKEILPAYGLRLLGLIGRNLINILDFTTLPILNQGTTKDLLFLVPPIEEQANIIEEINKISDSTKQSIIKFEQEIAAIKEYREALITDLVTGKRGVPQTQKR